MSDTKTMGLGRREDLKAIWGEVSQFNAMQWEVNRYVFLGVGASIAKSTVSQFH